MKRLLAFTCLVLLVAGLAQAVDRWEQDITVSPNVVVLGSANTQLTIHSTIQASDVVNDSVVLYIDGSGPFAPSGLFVDDRGNIVVRFMLDDLRGALAPTSAVFNLRGQLTNGNALDATDTITVK